MDNYHFSCKWKAVGDRLDDGTGCVILGFADRENGNTEVYPLHLSDAMNIAKCLLNMVIKVALLKHKK